MKQSLFVDINRYVNRLKDQTTPYNVEPTQKRLCEYNLVDTPLEQFVDLALDRKVIFLDEKAFYLMKLTDDELPYRSLVFQIDGTILKSAETTGQIMARYFKRLQVPYSSSSDLGKLVNIHQKCPYVTEDVCFAPDGGVSKKSVNWVGLHHIKYFEGNMKKTTICLAPHSELVLPLSIQQVHTMVEHGSLIALMQQAILECLTKQFSFMNTYAHSNNVITDYIHKLKYEITLPSPQEMYQFMDQKRILNLLKSIMGVDYPTKEELDKVLPSLDTFRSYLDMDRNK